MQIGKKSEVKWLVNRTASLGYGIAVSLLVAVSVTSYLEFLNFKQAEKWVERTQAVLKQNQEILTLVTDAETGQRGYLLTNNEGYLQPYRAAIVKIPPKIKLIRQLVADNPNQQQRLDKLNSLVEAKLLELKQTIYLRQNQGLDAALELVKTNRGEQLMIEIRRRSAEIATAENRLLQGRSRQAERQAQFTVLAIFLSSGIGFGSVLIAGILVNRELTERQRAEKIARENESRFRVLAEVMPQLVWSGSNNGTIDYCNSRWQQYTGSTPQEIESKLTLLHPEDRNNTLLVWKLALETTQEYEAEERLRGVDGTYRWFLTRALPDRNETGQIIKWYGTCTDIEDQKRIQEMLWENSERLQLVVEATKLGTWDWNLITGVILISDRFKALFGVSPEASTETSYEDCLSLIHPEDRVQIDQQVQQALQPNSNGELIVEYRILKTDGTVNWLVSMGRVLYQNGQAYRFIGTVLDISDRKLAQEQIQASLTEKIVLLKEIHHRVKNNLQIVISLLNLQSSRLENPQIQNILQECQARINSMALIHEQLYQSENLGKIDLAKYVQNLVDNLSNSYDIYNSDIQVKTSVEDIYLSVDTAIPCGLMLNELISNALKHAFPLETKGEINIDFYLKDDYFHLMVKDNGVGISPELNIDKTTSLGLQLVKALTRQLQGNITLNSDKECEFEIIFGNK